MITPVSSFSVTHCKSKLDRREHSFSPCTHQQVLSKQQKEIFVNLKEQPSECHQEETDKY